MKKTRPIPGFDRYEIDKNGNVISYRHNNPRVLKKRMMRGYVKYCLYDKDNKPRHLQAHRLVWESFVGAIPFKQQINHKNGVKDDNRLSNLEVVSMSDNLKHRYSVLGLTGVRGSKNNWAKLNETKVSAIRQRLRDGATHASLAIEYGISRPSISLIAARQTWPHVT